MRTFTNHDCDHVKASISIFGYTDEIEISKQNSQCGFLYVRWNGYLKPLCVNINNAKLLNNHQKKLILKGLCSTFGLDYLWMNIDLQPSITFLNDHIGLEIDQKSEFNDNIHPRHFFEIPFIKLRDNEDGFCTQPPFSVKLWCRIFDRLPRPPLKLFPSIVSMQSYIYYFYRPALWETCGPTHLLRNHYGEKPHIFDSRLSNKYIEPYKASSSVNSTSFILSKTFFQCQLLCGKSKTCVGFSYVPMKNPKIIGYCSLTNNYCDADPNYAYTYIPAGHLIYVKTFYPCLKYVKSKINIFYDKPKNVCFVIKKNLTFFDSINYCKNMRMNMFKPNLMSKSVNTFFPSFDHVWMSPKLFNYRLYYSSNFINGHKYKVLNSNKPQNINISNLSSTDCAALRLSYNRKNFSQFFDLDEKKLRNLQAEKNKFNCQTSRYFNCFFLFCSPLELLEKL